MLALIAIVSSSLCGGTRPIPRDRALADHVALSVETDKAEYRLKEPIRVRLTFRNLGGTPVVGYFKSPPYCGLIEVQYRDMGSSFSAFSGGASDLAVRRQGDVVLLRQLALQPERLLPEEEFVHETTLVYDVDADSFVLSASGAYEMRAVYRDPGGDGRGTLMSEPVRIHSSAPPGSDRDAASVFSVELARLVQNPQWIHGYVETRGRIEAAAEFLERYRGTNHARHVREALVRALRDPALLRRATGEERLFYEELREREGVHK